jgi:ubiquitin-like protein Pup
MSTSEQRPGEQRRTGGAQEAPTEEQAVPAGTERREDLSADVDSILDEIDAVLEENAEEFVKSFVQKGGQ